jgi:hypothetical protein
VQIYKAKSVTWVEFRCLDAKSIKDMGCELISKKSRA